jgi:hypothetical protein
MIQKDWKLGWVVVALLCPFAAALLGLGLERALRLFLALWFPWGVVALVLMIGCIVTQETRTR